MSLGKKVKTSLDETRLLMLGAQVLFGFQLQSVFQDGFESLPAASRWCDSIAMALMALSIVFLITPSMFHRVVEAGEDTKAVLGVTTLFACLGMAPFGLSLGLDFYLVVARFYSLEAAVVAGAAFCALAYVFWFGLGMALRMRRGKSAMDEDNAPTPISTKIDQLLTEARVIVPGAQALLGFELTVMLTQAFSKLPGDIRAVHLAALCCVAVCVTLLMTPAALHRIAYGGEDSEAFYKIGSSLVFLAAAPLALGISGDLYVAASVSTHSAVVAFWLAIAAALCLFGFWYAYPIATRARRQA